MPYGTPWDSNRPPGTTSAKNIDDEIRLLRGQLEERLEDQLITDITADPWVLKDNVKGLANGLFRYIPFMAFRTDLHAKEDDISTIGLSPGQINGFCGNPVFAPIDLPPGCIITMIEYLVDPNSAASLDCQIRHRAFADAAAVATIDNTINVVAGAGLKISATPALTLTLDANTIYWLDIIGNGPSGNSFVVVGARITFNRPSLDNAT